MNTHSSIVGHSLIFESILWLMSKYSEDEAFRVESGLSEMHYLYVLLESTLFVKERQDVPSYIEGLKQLSLDEKRCLLLENRLDLSQIQEMLWDEEVVLQVLSHRQIQDVEAFKAVYLEPEATFETLAQLLYRECVVKEEVRRRYQEQIHDLDQFRDMIQEELKKRHPLSYAQSLMGKSFYNIADWSEYEFVPVSNGPFKAIRLMNKACNIVVYNIHQKGNSQKEVGDRLQQGLKLLADPKRLEIMRMIFSQPMCGKDIAEAMNLTTATVSHHMDLMRKAGLLHEERDQNTKFFSVNYHAVMGLSRDLQIYILRRK
jgi:DNA-binding transcriptional ArsR family regulator